MTEKLPIRRKAPNNKIIVSNNNNNIKPIILLKLSKCKVQMYRVYLLWRMDKALSKIKKYFNDIVGFNLLYFIYSWDVLLQIVRINTDFLKQLFNQ